MVEPFDRLEAAQLAVARAEATLKRRQNARLTLERGARRASAEAKAAAEPLIKAARLEEYNASSALTAARKELELAQKAAVRSKTRTEEERASEAGLSSKKRAYYERCAAMHKRKYGG